MNYLANLNPWPILWGIVAVLFAVFLCLPYDISKNTRIELKGMVSGAPDANGVRVISIHRVGLAIGIVMLAWTDVKITNAVVRWIDKSPSTDPIAYFYAAVGGIGSLAGITFLGKNLIQAKANQPDPKAGA